MTRATVLAALLFVLLAASMLNLWYTPPVPFSGSTEAIARALFMDNMLPFLGAGVLLLGAMISAIYLAKKEDVA